MFTDISIRWAKSSESDLVYRMTVDEYDRLAAAGVLDNLRAELIDGMLVRREDPGRPHARAVDAAYEQLDRWLSPDLWIREEKPVRIPCFDVLQPDLSVVRGRRAEFRRRHPGRADIALLVEVAEGTLEIDRNEKMRAYASGDIPIYWIINLIDRQVEIYSEPQKDHYGSLQVFEPGQLLPLAIDGGAIGPIAVADLLD